MTKTRTPNEVEMAALAGFGIARMMYNSSVRYRDFLIKAEGLSFVEANHFACVDTNQSAYALSYENLFRLTKWSKDYALMLYNRYSNECDELVRRLQHT